MGSGEPSSLREEMKAMSGKLLDANNQEFDLTALMAAFLATIGSGNGAPANQIATLTHLETKVHGGQAFLLNIRNVAVASGGTLIMTIQTDPDIAEIHVPIIRAYSSEDPATYELLEGVTPTGGAPVTPINRNRNSTTACGCTILSDPAIAGGAVINTKDFGGGGGRNAEIAGAAGEIAEWILNPVNTYAIRLTNGHAINAAIMNIEVIYAMETD